MVKKVPPLIATNSAAWWTTLSEPKAGRPKLPLTPRATLSVNNRKESGPVG